MRSEEESLIEAIYASPGDDALRLVYADWLEERGDPRSDYLRAEVEHFRRREDTRGSALGTLQQQGDPVWAAMVSRAPFGILVPGLTFRDTGPKIRRSDLKKIERRWREPLPPDYAAFLLRHNGGRPSKPYLWSYADYPDGTSHYYDEVRFFSAKDRPPGGRPYLLSSVVEVFHGHVAERQDEARLARMMPIWTLTQEEGRENLLALVMDNEEFERIVEVEYWENRGLGEADDVHAKDTFVGLLMALCERSEGR